MRPIETGLHEGSALRADISSMVSVLMFKLDCKTLKQKSRHAGSYTSDDWPKGDQIQDTLMGRHGIILLCFAGHADQVIS